MTASVEDLINEIPNPPAELISSERRDLETVRRWIDWVLSGVYRLNIRCFGDSEVSPFVRELVLQNAFPAVIYSWHGGSAIGKSSLVHAWLDSSLLAGLDTERLDSLRSLFLHQWPVSTLNLTAGDAELLAIFNAAVGERMVAERAEWQGRQVIRDLVVRLGLTTFEVAAMLDVPEDIVKDWESGRSRIPADSLDRLQVASAALSRLLGVFRPDRLPQVIRRDAELFDGGPALEWIKRGRITEVAEKYESILAYQA
jgi:hypothetical protein